MIGGDCRLSEQKYSNASATESVGTRGSMSDER